MSSHEMITGKMSVRSHDFSVEFEGDIDPLSLSDTIGQLVKSRAEHNRKIDRAFFWGKFFTITQSLGIALCVVMGVVFLFGGCSNNSQINQTQGGYSYE